MTRLWLLLGLAACVLPVDAPSPAPPPVGIVPVVAARAPSAPASTPVSRPVGPVVCGLDPVVTGPDDDRLRALGARAGLDHPDAFASVVQTVRATGRLPDCYLTKREAEQRGWTRGGRVWDAVPGGAIGGDVFGNREGHLPGGLRFAEADLDQGPGPRGADRLVFVPGASGSDARVWLTVDHYDTFDEVLP